MDWSIISSVVEEEFIPREWTNVINRIIMFVFLICLAHHHVIPRWVIR